MGPNQSKPEEKKNKVKKNPPNNKENAAPSAAVDANAANNVANAPGNNAVPLSPMTPVTPTTRAGRPLSSAPGELHFEVHELDGHSNVTRPTPPRALRHLSDLIDPADLAAGSHVRSPSGNMLTAAEFAAYPDRPMSLRERREAVMQRTAAASTTQLATIGEAGTGEGQAGNATGTTTTVTTPKENRKGGMKAAWKSCFCG